MSLRSRLACLLLPVLGLSACLPPPPPPPHEVLGRVLGGSDHDRHAYRDDRRWDRSDDDYDDGYEAGYRAARRDAYSRY